MSTPESNPSIKNPRMYESLRDDGASKEKAARISNAAARDGSSTIGKRGGKAPAYEDWTLEELRERARELDIEGRSSMNKSELIKALRNH